jgi:hypothetical protein
MAQRARESDIVAGNIAAIAAFKLVLLMFSGWVNRVVFN